VPRLSLFQTLSFQPPDPVKGAELVSTTRARYALWDIKRYPVWITKYRDNLLPGEVTDRTLDLLREICATWEMRILPGCCRSTTSAC
jgi:hypothetical protein